MRAFSAEVVDAGGTGRTIVREAADDTALKGVLRAEGMLVVSVKELKPGVFASFRPSNWLRMTSFDAEIGFRQLSSMLKSGVGLVMALETVRDQARRRRAADVWDAVRLKVMEGSRFADALEGCKGRFDSLSIHLARVGEESGELDSALLKASEQIEARRSLKSLVAHALSYPAIAVAMAILVSAYLVTAVIPKIGEFLVNSGAELPAMTRMMLDVSDWTVENGLTVLAVMAALAASWFALRASAAGRELEDAFLLRLPVVGGILRLSATALVSRSADMMLASGITLVDTLEMLSRLPRNSRFRRRLRDAQERVVRGESLSDALSAAVEFPPMMRRMAAVGEVTGSLADSFSEVARYHEEMLGVAVRRLGALMEPLILCVTALIVGFVYVSFFMALFSLATAG